MMLALFSLAILTHCSFPTVAKSVETYYEDSAKVHQLAVAATTPEDSVIMQSVPLFEEEEAEGREVIPTYETSTLSSVLRCLRAFIRDVLGTIREFLISILKYLLGILEPRDDGQQETLSPEKEHSGKTHDHNPITIEIDALTTEKAGALPTWKTASDESLNHSEGSSLHVHELKESSRPRRSSVSLISDSGLPATSEEKLTPVDKLKRMSDSFPRSKGHRNRSASATPSSPGYAAPTVSSMNMRSPVIGRRSSELTRRKKLLEDEREEKLDDIRKRNRLYKDDVLRLLEEQQEERTKYVESIKNSKSKSNKLSQSMH